MTTITQQLAPQGPLDSARRAIEPYGYGLTDDGVFTRPDGRVLGVCLRKRGKRYQARAVNDHRILWSGMDPAAFIRWFWYATLKTEGSRHA